MMHSLGYSDKDTFDIEPRVDIGRVSIVHGAHCEVIWSDHTGTEQTSDCRLSPSPAQRPVAGDWVRLSDGKITHVMTRRSALQRPDPNGRDVQVLAANLDLVLLVVPINRGLNVRMLERFAIMAWESGAQPFVVLTKSDAARNIAALMQETALAVPGVEILTTSSESGEGIEHLRALLHEGVTAVMLGASGAGKTSLLNALEGSAEVTRSVTRSGEGRHATTTRKLYRLNAGGVLLDIPGIRLLDLLVGQEGVNETFADIGELAVNCRFRDCAHNGDLGCAVEAAVVSGALARRRLENWRAVQSELTHQEHRRSPEEMARGRRSRPAPTADDRNRDD
ncbi:MAG: ribosome small subunit-dependent GTPase A [Acidobacteria bacterium]|nr:ribosome small subunit-dependent GTPase A [Acidobacteriota bacterium]